MRLTRTSGSGKPLVRMFLSFARRDTDVAGRMWELLAEATAVDRIYGFELWRFDEALLVGESWDARIRAALADNELGVLAVSNASLGSKYVTEVELPAFLNVVGKRIVPVLLRKPNKHADWRGLDGKQIYGRDRPFAELRTRAARDTWVNGLVDQLHRVLDRYGRPADGTE